MKRALLRQDGALLAAQVFFLGLIAYELVSGRPWDALGAFGALGACLVVPAVRGNSRLLVPPLVDRATAVMVFGTIFLGERLDFYERFWWWDLAAHAISGALLCCLAAILFDQLTRTGPRSKAMLKLIFVLGTSLAVAALWEVVEYLLDQGFDADTQLGSLDDTMTDVIAHLGGAVLATASLVARLRAPATQRPQRSPQSCSGEGSLARTLRRQGRTKHPSSTPGARQ